MLRIGDFARLAGVTVRALRHYEAEGLLAPAHVDEVTGYRSYRFEQLAELDRIVALRDLGFPLADIRELIGTQTGMGELLERVQRQRSRVAAEVERQSSRLRRLAALQHAIAADPAAPQLSVRVRPTPDVHALTIRARVSRGEQVTAMFEQAEAAAARHRVDSSPFLLFHGRREVEACIPVRPDSRAARVRVVPGAPLAASVVYSGAYSQTRPLHARMLRWLARSGMRPSGPLREVYHRFGADQLGYRLPPKRLAARPEKFVTELQVPAEEAK
jgi:DNA-binding transcriptional MerR regulator